MQQQRQHQASIHALKLTMNLTSTEQMMFSTPNQGD